VASAGEIHGEEIPDLHAVLHRAAYLPTLGRWLETTRIEINLWMGGMKGNCGS
jgi:hypothetical protein